MKRIMPFFVLLLAACNSEQDARQQEIARMEAQVATLEPQYQRSRRSLDSMEATANGGAAYDKVVANPAYKAYYTQKALLGRQLDTLRQQLAAARHDAEAGK